MPYSFDIPNQNKSIIKVIGVGGGGSNAVNHMFNLGIKDVEFVVCNTDAQALNSSSIPHKLQIGVSLTDGLGAGANPEKGRNAAIESEEDIRNLLGENTKMVFITAGMGGGTGTGAAPIIAQIAKELDILTVGIVTAPFAFEGKKKLMQAEEGIQQMRQYCDTVLVILNDKLREIYGNLSIREAFGRADNILTTAAKSIAEIITVTTYMNVDFADVSTVMKNSGAAVMGSAIASGENRAVRAIEEALVSPLLNNTDIFGAKKVLLSIMHGAEDELSMDELTEITDYIEARSGAHQELILGQGVDPELGNSIRVTVIATGFESKSNDSFETPKEAKVEVNTVVETPKQISLFDIIETKTLQKITDEPSAPLVKETIVEFELPIETKIEPIVSETISTTSDAPKVVESSFSAPEVVVFEKPQLEPKTETAPFTMVWDAVNNNEHTPVETKSEEISTSAIETVASYTFEVQNNTSSQETVFNQTSNENNDDNTYKVIHKEPISELSEDELYRLEARKRLQAASMERVNRLKNMSGVNSISHEEFKDMCDRPAYERKNVVLKDFPHSSERNISRFNLNDDNEILGNNKFLHDNVD
jgi:cell division protein FtsZ